MKFKNNHILILLLFGFLYPKTSLCQIDFTQQFDIPVYDLEGHQLKFPWTGGLASPIISEVDLNQDGFKDIFVFDRNDNRILTFLNDGIIGEISYSYTKEFDTFFPESLSKWVLWEDMTCDGIPDIITGTDNQITVFQSVYDNGWSFVGLGNIQSDGIEIDLDARNLPAFADMDNDGDIDLLMLNSLGRGLFYRNLSIENNDGCMIESFTLETDCWGDFEYKGVGPSADLELGCQRLDNRSPYHGGFSLNLHDWDDDNDLDLFIGDATLESVAYLINGGDDIFTNQDSLFPSSDTSIELKFPIVSILDLNNDGDEELVASTSLTYSKIKDNVWLYNSTGELETKSFLIQEMIDIGKGSHISSFDYDSDGDIDLLLSPIEIEYPDGVYAKVTLYENIGSNQFPTFQFITDDFLNLSSLNKGALDLEFYDIDSDGDSDMFVGTFNDGVYFYRNNGNGTFQNEPDSNLPIASLLMNITFGDIDDDGSDEMIYGKYNGKIAVYDISTVAGLPEFTEVEAEWCGINVWDEINPGQANVCFSSVDGNNYLFTGSRTKGIQYFNASISDCTSIQNIYVKGFDQTSHFMEGVAFEKNLLVGNLSGGIEWFSYGMSTSLEEPAIMDAEVSVSPNPISNEGILRFTNLELPSKVIIYDISGRVLRQQEVLDGNLRINNLPKGIYFIKLEGNNASTKLFVY